MAADGPAAAPGKACPCLEGPVAHDCASTPQSPPESPAQRPASQRLRVLLCAYGALDEARQGVRRLRTVATVAMPSSAHFGNPEHRELFLSGLRLAARESG